MVCAGAASSWRVMVRYVSGIATASVRASLVTTRFVMVLYSPGRSCAGADHLGQRAVRLQRNAGCGAETAAGAEGRRPLFRPDRWRYRQPDPRRNPVVSSALRRSVGHPDHGFSTQAWLNAVISDHCGQTLRFGSMVKAKVHAWYAWAFVLAAGWGTIFNVQTVGAP